MTTKQYIELFEAFGNEAADDAIKAHEKTSNGYFTGKAWTYANVINLLKNPALAETIYKKAVKHESS